MTALKHRWLEVLAASTAAVDSAVRARLIGGDESRVHSRRVAIERTWLETVDWRVVRTRETPAGAWKQVVPCNPDRRDSRCRGDAAPRPSRQLEPTRGGAMVKYSNGQAASLLESAGPGTCRPAVSRRRPPARPVRKTEEDRIVRVPLCQGTFELRVPGARGKAKQPALHIEGFNADATPC
jgi:hypothetical protein